MNALLHKLTPSDGDSGTPNITELHLKRTLCLGNTGKPSLGRRLLFWFPWRSDLDRPSMGVQFWIGYVEKPERQLYS